jgi:hypothetical protein
MLEKKLLSMVALVATACGCSGKPDPCTLRGASGATTGTVTRAGKSVDIQDTHGIVEGGSVEATSIAVGMHDALEDSTDASGDLLWQTPFELGSFSIAIRFPVTVGASISVASEPLTNLSSWDFRPAGELTGGAGAATRLQIGDALDFFASTAASGTIEIVDNDPLVLNVICDYQDSKAGETVTLHAKVTLEATEEHDPNCN